MDVFHHIVLIEGELLDRRVNDQRDGFDGIPDEIPVSDLFAGTTVSYAGIFEQIDPIIEEMVPFRVEQGLGRGGSHRKVRR